METEATVKTEATVETAATAETEAMDHQVLPRTAMVAEVIWIHTKESTQRNPKRVALQTDTMGKKPGLVENQIICGQDWKHPTQSTFLNHLRCDQAAQKLLLVTSSAPKECL